MKLYQLAEIFPDISATLRTSNCSGTLLFHWNTTSRAKPLSAPSISRRCECEFLGFLSPTYECGMKMLSHVLRQLHLTAHTLECTTALFHFVAAHGAIHRCSL